MDIDPYAAVATPAGQQALYVLALVALPAEPVDLAAVLAVASPIAPAKLVYESDPVEALSGTVAMVQGSIQWSYPLGGMQPLPIVALAIVYGKPPSALVAWTVLPEVQVLSGPNEVVLADICVLAGRQPG